LTDITIDGLKVMIGLVGLGLGLGLAIGIKLGLKLTIGPILGFRLKIGPILGLVEAPVLGVADAVAVPAAGVGVLSVPVFPDGALLAWAVAVPVTVASREAVGSAAGVAVCWPLFWPASAVGVAWVVAVGVVDAPDIKGSFRSVHPDIIKTDNNITDINAIDLFDNTKIMHLYTMASTHSTP
jgi:hypothetical protein